MRATAVVCLFAVFAYLAVGLTFATRPPPPHPPSGETAVTRRPQRPTSPLPSPPPPRRQPGHRYHKDEYHDKMAAASDFYAYKRGRDLEYFPGVGMVEPLGLITVAAIPLFVLFATFWLILPLWIRMTGVGILPGGPGLVPGALLPGTPVGPGGVVAGRRRRDLSDHAVKLLSALDETIKKYSRYTNTN